MMLRYVSTFAVIAGGVGLAGCKAEGEVEGDIDEIIDDFCDACDDDKQECPSDFECPDEADDYWVDLHPVNGSGVIGDAWIELNEFQQLRVSIEAVGLDPEVTVVQHFHGFEDNTINSVCAPLAADTDQDGFITTEEGLPYTGPVLLPLEPYPVSDAQGNMSFDVTFDAGDTCPLQNRLLMLHSPDGLPIACGQVRKATDDDLNTMQ